MEFFGKDVFDLPQAEGCIGEDLLGIPIGAAVYNFLYMSFDVRDAVLKFFAPCPLGTYPVLPFNQFPAANLLKPLPYAFASAARKIRRCLSSSSGSIIRIRSSMVIPPYNHNTIYFQNSKSIFAQFLTPNSHANSLDVICPLTDKTLMISILRCAVSMLHLLSLPGLKTVRFLCIPFTVRPEFMYD